MSLTSTEIAMVARKWNDQLVGGAVRKVISPARSDRLTLEIWADGKNEYAQLVVSRFSCRVCRTTFKPKAAPRPHPFVMLLRREAVGMIITSVMQLGNDRVLAIELEGKDRSGSIVCELTSRHSNIFWLDGDQVITGSFHTNRSHVRPLVPGQKYKPPVPVSPAQTIRDRFDDNKKLEEQIEAHYHKVELEQELTSHRVSASRAVRSATKKIDRLSAKLDEDAKRAAQAKLLRHQAHLLQANLRSARKGMEELQVVDFEGGKAVVPLDPRMGPVANMERMFDKAKRLDRASGRIDERRAEAVRWSSSLAAIGAEIEEAGIKRLEEIVAQLVRRFPDLARRSSGKSKAVNVRLPYNEFAIAAGRTALVGRSAEDNDTLTLRHARPDDLWLHVRGQKGSHVVVSMGRGEEPSPDILVDAAHLAAHFSDARGDDDVEVTYTRRRYVQKPKGAAKGSVRLLKEKTIALRVDKKRLEELLASDSQSPAPTGSTKPH